MPAAETMFPGSPSGAVAVPDPGMEVNERQTEDLESPAEEASGGLAEDGGVGTVAEMDFFFKTGVRYSGMPFRSMALHPNL